MHMNAIFQKKMCLTDAMLITAIQCRFSLMSVIKKFYLKHCYRSMPMYILSTICAAAQAASDSIVSEVTAQLCSHTTLREAYTHNPDNGEFKTMCRNVS